MIESDVQRLNPGTVVDMFDLDTTEQGGDILRWHNGVNKLLNDVVWQGNIYARYPIIATGFERSSKGVIPKPHIKLSNTSGVIAAIARGLPGGIEGAKVVRHRTFYRYLDAVNYPGGVNPEADPDCAFANEIWFVDRKVGENGIFLEYELSAAFDVRGVKLPRRQCIQNVCPWAYRGAECGYTGGPVASKYDVPSIDPTQDACGKRLTSCKLRFGTYAQLPFGGFPGVGLVR